MPIYTNPTSTVISYGPVRVEPGESKTTNVFIPTASLNGLVQTTATPVYSPTLQSAKISGTTTVTVPAALTGNYKIHIFVPAGTNELTIKLSDASDVARLIGPGETVEYICMNRVINSVIVTAITGVAYITIESI
jgi:hypothetical protein